MVRVAVATALALVAALLQSLLGEAPLIAARPDLVLLVVLAWAVAVEPGEAATVGFLGGLLLDSVSYTPFGLNGALFGLECYAMSAVMFPLLRGNVLSLIGAGVVATALYQAATALALQAWGFTLPPLERLVVPLFGAMLLNGLLLPFVSAFCRRIVRALSGWRQMQV